MDEADVQSILVDIRCTPRHHQQVRTVQVDRWMIRLLQRHLEGGWHARGDSQAAIWRADQEVKKLSVTSSLSVDSLQFSHRASHQQQPHPSPNDCTCSAISVRAAAVLGSTAAVITEQDPTRQKAPGLHARPVSTRVGNL